MQDVPIVNLAFHTTLLILLEAHTLSLSLDLSLVEAHFLSLDFPPGSGQQRSCGGRLKGGVM